MKGKRAAAHWMVLFGNLLGNYSGWGDVDGGVVYEMEKQNILQDR
jgi:hypothetical protein